MIIKIREFGVHTFFKRKINYYNFFLFNEFQLQETYNLLLFIVFYKLKFLYNFHFNNSNNNNNNNKLT
jgi:hypothetical protein